MQHEIQIEEDAEIPTWFGIGGRAARLARPASTEELAKCLQIDPALRILGDGANLLVDDDGVHDLVVTLTHPAMREVVFENVEPDRVRITAMAGANLPKLVTECVRRGLGGLEGLGGIPATIGGAVIMNAGGAFGQIGDVVSHLHALDRRGNEVSIPRDQIDFGYRHSGLNHLLITRVELHLQPGDKQTLRQRLKEVMAYKKNTQPMAEDSAGCVFRNPLLPHDVDGIGQAGSRVSAGMLLDRAGCKGMRIGGAEISHGHANFFVTREGALARDIIELMDAARTRVRDVFDVTLEPEVVIWRRS